MTISYSAKEIAAPGAHEDPDAEARDQELRSRRTERSRRSVAVLRRRGPRRAGGCRARRGRRTPGRRPAGPRRARAAAGRRPARRRSRLQPRRPRPPPPRAAPDGSSAARSCWQPPSFSSSPHRARARAGHPENARRRTPCPCSPEAGRASRPSAPPARSPRPRSSSPRRRRQAAKPTAVSRALSWSISAQFIEHLSTRTLGGGATFDETAQTFTFPGASTRGRRRCHHLTRTAGPSEGVRLQQYRVLLGDHRRTPGQRGRRGRRRDHRGGVGHERGVRRQPGGLDHARSGHGRRVRRWRPGLGRGGRHSEWTRRSAVRERRGDRARNPPTPTKPENPVGGTSFNPDFLAQLTSGARALLRQRRDR